MKTFSTSVANLEIRRDVIYVRLADDVQLEKEMVIELQQAMEKLANGRKYKVLLDATNGFFSAGDSSVFENSKRTDIAVNRMAQALVSNVLPTKLLMNFYSNTVKPPFPTKSFKTVSEAEEWLNSIDK